LGPNTGADKLAMSANSDDALAPIDGIGVADPAAPYVTNDV
jgi:hypothetical protein